MSPINNQHELPIAAMEQGMLSFTQLTRYVLS